MSKLKAEGEAEGAAIVEGVGDFAEGGVIEVGDWFGKLGGVAGVERFGAEEGVDAEVATLFGGQDVGEGGAAGRDCDELASKSPRIPPSCCYST